MEAQGVKSNLWITAALLNNLSQVNKVFHNEYEAQQCDELLLSAVLLLVDLNDGNNNQSSTIVEGFLSNVIHLILRDSNIASVA